MSAPFKYSLLRYQPHMSRHEVVNVGVVLFAPNGPEVRQVEDLKKLRMLDPNVSAAEVTRQIAALQHTLEHLYRQGCSAEEAVKFLSRGSMGPSCGTVGWVEPGEKPVPDILDELMRELVLPPARQRAATEGRSRLHTELRLMFNQAKMLGKEPGDISNHLVVPNFPIDADLGLFAEFALRNGRLHVTETVDFRVKDRAAKKREAESKAMVLVQALDTVGRDDLQCHVVISGAADDNLQPSVKLLRRYADNLFVREDAADWQQYCNLMHQAAQQRAADARP
jgi:hypothetical protein